MAKKPIQITGKWNSRTGKILTRMNDKKVPPRNSRVLAITLENKVTKLPIATKRKTTSTMERNTIKEATNTTIRRTTGTTKTANATSARRWDI
jgi:hypothetical protein